MKINNEEENKEINVKIQEVLNSLDLGNRIIGSKVRSLFFQFGNPSSTLDNISNEKANQLLEQLTLCLSYNLKK
jgi:hypothetical protein